MRFQCDRMTVETCRSSLVHRIDIRSSFRDAVRIQSRLQRVVSWQCVLLLYFVYRKMLFVGSHSIFFLSFCSPPSHSFPLSSTLLLRDCLSPFSSMMSAVISNARVWACTICATGRLLPIIIAATVLYASSLETLTMPLESAALITMVATA